MRLRKMSVAMLSLCLTSVPNDANAGEMMSGDSFLYSEYRTQSDYISGVIDTLKHIARHGQLEESFISCVLSHDEVSTLIDLVHATRVEIRERVKTGKITSSAASALIDRAQESCEKGTFPEGLSHSWIFLEPYMPFFESLGIEKEDINRLSYEELFSLVKKNIDEMSPDQIEQIERIIEALP